jgi:hypothetical protein
MQNVESVYKGHKLSHFSDCMFLWHSEKGCSHGVIIVHVCSRYAFRISVKTLTILRILAVVISPSKQMTGLYFNLGHEFFLLNRSKFIICCHLIIWCFIVWVTDIIK